MKRERWNDRVVIKIEEMHKECAYTVGSLSITFSFRERNIAVFMDFEALYLRQD